MAADDLDFFDNDRIYLNGAILSNNGVYQLMRKLHASASRTLTTRDIMDCALQLNFAFPLNNIFDMADFKRADQEYPLDLDHPDRCVSYRAATVWILTLTKCSRKVGLLGSYDDQPFVTLEELEK